MTESEAAYWDGILAKYKENEAIRNFLNLIPVIYGSLGHFESAACRESRYGDGSPQPWFCYSAIDYIRGLDLRGRRVFEYGAGMSTLFWAAKCGRVVSVESDREWFEKLKLQVPPVVELMLRPTGNDYIEALRTQEGAFDIIVVDGDSKVASRKLCAEAALDKVAEDGLIILDNSDVHVQAAEVLRRPDLLQVDMIDFAPGNWWRHGTSFFFKRTFRAEPAERWMPLKTVGCQPVFADE